MISHRPAPAHTNPIKTFKAIQGPLEWLLAAVSRPLWLQSEGSNTSNSADPRCGQDVGRNAAAGAKEESHRRDQPQLESLSQ